jgi:hypothetical protein
MSILVRGFLDGPLVTSGYVSGTGSGAATAPAGRDWDVLGAIRDLLTLTGQFDLVALSGLPEDRGFAAVSTACVIQPGAWEDVDEWDDAVEVSIPRRVSWTLTILVRDSDPEVRDSTADRLSNLAQDTLDGVSLGGITLPGRTKLRRGVWSRPASAERRLVLAGEFTYIVSGFAGHDDTD